MKYQLCQGELLLLEADGAIEALTVTCGQLWVTRSDDTRDYCLESGDRLKVRRGEQLMLEALAPSDLTIVCSESRAGMRVTMAGSRPCTSGDTF